MYILSFVIICSSKNHLERELLKTTIKSTGFNLKPVLLF
jgi:hypothetical protein